jgi:hypothetical protein
VGAPLVRNIHYPPETATVFLLARVVAMLLRVRQAQLAAGDADAARHLGPFAQFAMDYRARDLGTPAGISVYSTWCVCVCVCMCVEGGAACKARVCCRPGESAIVRSERGDLRHRRHVGESVLMHTHDGHDAKSERTPGTSISAHSDAAPLFGDSVQGQYGGAAHALAAGVSRARAGRWYAPAHTYRIVATVPRTYTHMHAHTYRKGVCVAYTCMYAHT